MYVVAPPTGVADEYVTVPVTVELTAVGFGENTSPVTFGNVGSLVTVKVALAEVPLNWALAVCVPSASFSEKNVNVLVVAPASTVQPPRSTPSRYSSRFTPSVGAAAEIV